MPGESHLTLASLAWFWCGGLAAFIGFALAIGAASAVVVLCLSVFRNSPTPKEPSWFTIWLPVVASVAIAEWFNVGAVRSIDPLNGFLTDASAPPAQADQALMGVVGGLVGIALVRALTKGQQASAAQGASDARRDVV
jgi:hypothetical protein